MARLHDVLRHVGHRARDGRPKKYVEKVGDDGLRSPIGRGPYRFVSFNPGVELVLEAYEGYWRKTPSVNAVLRSLPEETRGRRAQEGRDRHRVSSDRARRRGYSRTPGLKLTAPSRRAASSGWTCPISGSPVAVGGPARASGGQPRDRSQRRSTRPRRRALEADRWHHSARLRVLESFRADGVRSARAKQLMAEAGYPNGFRRRRLLPVAAVHGDG